MENISLLQLGVSFGFGVLAFLSPCVLPLLPGYLSFITGYNLVGGELPPRMLVMKSSLGFVAGFSAMFVALGAAATGLGQWLAWNQEVLSRLAGIIIIIFGLHISEILPLRLLYRQAGWGPGRISSGWLGSLIFGVTFAVSWTPCVGPMLASILLLAGSSDTVGQGVLLLTFFSLGLAVPFLLAALGAGTIQRWLSKSGRILPYVNAVSGGLLIAMGVLLLTGQWVQLMMLFI